MLLRKAIAFVPRLHVTPSLPSVQKNVDSPLYCLDYYCGNGTSTLELHRSFPEACIVGYEPRERILRHARSRHPHEYFTPLWRDVCSKQYQLIQVKNHVPYNASIVHHFYKPLSKKRGMLWIHRSLFHEVLDIFSDFHVYFEPMQEFKDMYIFIPNPSSRHEQQSYECPKENDSDSH